MLKKSFTKNLEHLHKNTKVIIKSCNLQSFFNEIFLQRNNVFVPNEITNAALLLDVFFIFMYYSQILLMCLYNNALDS